MNSSRHLLILTCVAFLAAAWMFRYSTDGVQFGDHGGAVRLDRWTGKVCFGEPRGGRWICMDRSDTPAAPSSP